MIANRGAAAIVDYGAGNLESVRAAVFYAGHDSYIASTPEALARADRIILPGVGAAGFALEQLRLRGFDQVLAEIILGKGRPLLGICLGMQILATQLHEFGRHQGLGWFSGEVVHLGQVASKKQRLPHIGWNQVTARPRAEALFGPLNKPREFYFCHSFAYLADDESIVAATTDFGFPMVSAVLRDSVFATQFHPERSSVEGERLISAFFDWKP